MSLNLKPSSILQDQASIKINILEHLAMTVYKELRMIGRFKFSRLEHAGLFFETIM